MGTRGGGARRKIYCEKKKKTRGRFLDIYPDSASFLGPTPLPKKLKERGFCAVRLKLSRRLKYNKLFSKTNHEKIFAVGMVLRFLFARSWRPLESCRVIYLPQGSNLLKSWICNTNPILPISPSSKQPPPPEHNLLPHSKQSKAKKIMDPNEEATSYLHSMLGQKLRIHTTDTRMFVGDFKCTDNVTRAPIIPHILPGGPPLNMTSALKRRGQKECNIILGQSFEYRLPTPSATANAAAAVAAASGSGVKMDMTSRYLGLIVVPGLHITKIEMDEMPKSD